MKSGSFAQPGDRAELGITRFGRGASPSHLRSVAHIDPVAITYRDEHLAGEADRDAAAAVVRGSEGAPWT